ncbi:MAG: hypothetical protein K2L84_01870 [Muribaculaceae bacterium]|nr:hypothetical protein [Muribaculaceae bacterium]
MNINDNVPGISIALIVSFLGIMLMSYFNWISFAISGKTADTASLITAAFFVISAFGLAAAVKGKQANTDFSVWRRLRWVGVALMVAAVAFTCYNAPGGINFSTFDRVKLKKSALNDVNTLSQVLSDYRTYENNRLSATVDGLENYVMFNAAQTDGTLLRFIAQEVLGGTNSYSLSRATIETYRNVAEQRIEGGNVNEYSFAVTKLRDAVNRWNYTEVNQLPIDIRVLADTLSTGLTSISRRLRFPEIKLVDGIYTCENDCRPLDITISPVNNGRSQNVNGEWRQYSINFPTDFADCFKPDIKTGIVMLFLALMYFFYYWIAYPGGRSTISRRSKKSDEYGTLL